MKPSARSIPTGPGSRGGLGHRWGDVDPEAWRARRREYGKAHPEDRREKRRAAQLVRDRAEVDMTEPVPKQRLMTTVEVAAYLGLHEKTVKKMGTRGDLRYFVVSARGDRRYRLNDVLACIRELALDRREVDELVARLTLASTSRPSRSGFRKQDDPVKEEK